jgi:para-nitrobenzyl esterase
MSLDDFAGYMQNIYGDGWQSAYEASDPQQAYRLALCSKADNAHALAMVSTQHIANHNDEARVYAYYFDHRQRGRNDDFYGSFHSSDLWFFFSSMRNVPGQRPWTDTDHHMADMMSS